MFRIYSIMSEKNDIKVVELTSPTGEKILGLMENNFIIVAGVKSSKKELEKRDITIRVI